MAGRETSTSLLIRGAVLLPVVLVLGACNNWTMYGGDATHSGHISSESTIGVRNVGSLVERGTSAPVNGTISSPPTVAGDVLYATADTADNTAGGTLYAYSADRSTNCSTPPAPQTCNPLWTEMPGGTNHGLTSSPAVDTSGGVVYVGSKDGILYAYSASSGSLLWQSPPLGGSINSSPTLANGYVYVSIVYGWTFVFDETNGTDGTNTGCAPAHAGLVCDPEWGDRTPGDVYSSPAVANGMMYTASALPRDPGGGTFYAFGATLNSWCSGTPYAWGSSGDLETCTPEWTAKWDGGGSSPAVANGIVYIGSSKDGLLAFSANRSADCRGTPYINEVCTPLWIGDIGRERSGGGPGSTPAVANGIVYIGARSGILYAFNASNGSLLWTEATGGTIDSSAMIADGVVYVGCSSNLANQGQVCKANLYAFNASNGRTLWTGTTGGSIDTSPIIDDGGSQRGFGAVTVGAGDRVFAFTLPWTRKGESTSKPRR